MKVLGFCTVIKSTVATVSAALLLMLVALTMAAGTANAATCTVTSPNDSCGPYSDPNVFTSSNGNDLVVQNDFSSIPQTLTAQGDNNWTVTANSPGQGDLSVKSYPATQVTYSLPNDQPDPSSDFGNTLTSSWANIDPSGSGQGYEYAFDDWLADPTKQSWTSDLEVMIWTDTFGSGTLPSGNDTGQVYTDATGTQWEMWVFSGTTTVSPDSTISFVRKTNAATGSIDRMGFYKYLQAHGMLASAYGIDQLNYGLEVRTTGTGQKTYGITNYTLVPNGQQQAQAPVVSTNTASSVSQTSATLNGSVNPNGQASTYQFEYGTTTGYGTSVPVPAGSAGSGSAAVPESANLTSLTPNTTYHYRIDGTNATGTAQGSDQQFTTSTTGSAVAYGTTGPSSSGAKKANTLTLTWTQAISGTNSAVLAETALGTVPGGDVNCGLGITDNGTAMTKLAVVHDDGQDSGYFDVFGLPGPPSGTNTFVAAVSSGCHGGTPKELTGGSESFTGVSQSAPFGTAVTAFGSGPTASVATSGSTSGNLVAGFAANGSSITSAASPATSRYIANQSNNTGAGNSAGATSPSTGSAVTMGWNVTSDWWGAAAVEVQHS